MAGGGGKGRGKATKVVPESSASYKPHTKTQHINRTKEDAGGVEPALGTRVTRTAKAAAAVEKEKAQAGTTDMTQMAAIDFSGFSPGDFKNLRQILDLYEDQCGVGKKVEGSSGDQIQGQQTTPKTIVNQQAENEQQVQQQTLPLLPETQQTPQVTTTKRKARVTRTAKETAQVGEALVGKGGVEQQNETVATVATKKHVNPEGGGQLQERERTGVQQNTTKPPKKKQATGTNDTGIAGTKERASVGRSTVHTAPTLQPYAFDQAGPMRKSFSTYRPTCLWSEQEHKGTLPLLYSSNDNDLSCVPTKPDFTKGTEDDPLVVGIRMFESFTKGWGPVIVSTAPGEEGLIMGYIQDNGDLLRGLLGASHSLEGKVVWRKTMEFGTTMIVFGSVEYRALTCPGNSHEFTRAHVPGDSETNKPSDQRVGGNRYG